MPFFDIHISQGSIATRLKRGGIFKHNLIANLLLSPKVKKVRKSVNIWWSYEQEFGVLFLTHGVDSYLQQGREAVACKIAEWLR